MVVCIEVSLHQGIASEVSPEEGGKMGQMTRWVAGGGRDVDVDDSCLDVIDSDEDALVFGGLVLGKKRTCL